MRHDQLTIGTFTRSLLIRISEDLGKFERARLEVRETSVTSSPAQFASLEAGEYDLVLTGPDNALAYRFLSNNPLKRSVPVEIIAAIDRGLGLSLCISPVSESIEAVRDGVVGVDVPQSGFAFVAYGLLEQAGLMPGAYTIATMGSTPGRASALIANTCQATILNAGNELRAQRDGCTVVSRVSDYGPYVGTVLAAMPSADRDELNARHRFTEVMRETTQEILSGQREAEVINASMALLDLNEVEAAAHYMIQRDPSHGLIADGLVDRASISTLISLRQRYLPTPELDSIMDDFDLLVIDGGWG